MQEAQEQLAGAASNGANDTRRAILAAARQRFLHYGYKKTTIDEIAAAARVGKGTVYLYFCGKEEILLTIMREVKANITAQMSAVAASLAPPDEKLRRIILAWVLTVHDACHTTAHGLELVNDITQPKIMEFMREEHEAQDRIIASVLREGVERGDFAIHGDDLERAAEHLRLAFVAFLPPYVGMCHTQQSCRWTLERRVSDMMEFVMHGLLRRRDI